MLNNNRSTWPARDGPLALKACSSDPRRIGALNGIINPIDSSVIHSCHHCQSKVLQRVEPTFPCPRDFQPLGLPEWWTVKWSRADAIKGAESGCKFLQYFLDYSGPGHHHSARSHTDNQDGYPEIIYSPLHRFPPRENVPQARFFIGGVFSGLLDVYTYPTDSAALLIPARPINENPKSEATFLLAREWLDTCLLSHSDCRKFNEEAKSIMPSRLIEIGGEINDQSGPSLYLRNISSDKTLYMPYAAVSYCWGGPQTVKAMKEAVHEWVTGAGVTFSDLPMTIQDAIIITKKLALRFIWVDALCIIQDDPDDSAREIAKMPHIFKGAVVTISASRAKACYEGFLQPREHDNVSGPTFKLPCQPQGLPLGSILLSLAKDYTNSLEEPIHSRAWTLQERLLSSRILDYRTTQLSWTCKSATYVDGGAADKKTPSARSEQLAFNIAALSRNDTRRFSLVSHEDPIYRQNIATWHYILENYTRRALSNADDRILAIAGIAEEYSAILGDEYLAGLWRSALPSELLWLCDSPTLKSRLSKYRAPSWSWVSVDGPISCSGRLLGLSSLAEDEISIEVVECKAKLASSFARFGSVQSGYLRINGRVKKALWTDRRKCLRDPDGSTVRPYLQGTAEADLISDSVFPDAKEDDLDESLKVTVSGPHKTSVGGDTDRVIEVWCLEIVSPQDTQTCFSAGLVLQMIDDNRFRRAGVFQYVIYRMPEEVPHQSEGVEKWFRAVEPRVIEII